MQRTSSSSSVLGEFALPLAPRLAEHGWMRGFEGAIFRGDSPRPH